MLATHDVKCNNHNKILIFPFYLKSEVFQCIMKPSDIQDNAIRNTIMFSAVNAKQELNFTMHLAITRIL